MKISRKGVKIQPFIGFLEFKMANTPISRAGLIVLRDNRLLLSQCNRTLLWNLPGGQIDNGDTAEETLIQDIKKALDLDINLDRLEYYCDVQAPLTHDTDTQITQKCYLYDLDGDTVNANQDIGDAQYFSFEEYQEEKHLTPVVLLVFEQLENDFF